MGVSQPHHRIRLAQQAKLDIAVWAERLTAGHFFLMLISSLAISLNYTLMLRGVLVTVQSVADSGSTEHGLHHGCITT